MKKLTLPNFSKRAWTLIIVVLLIVTAVCGLGIVRFTTTNAFFCMTCHQNQDPQEMWLPSRVHAAAATCVDCHSPHGGQIVPRRFSAGDELMNDNCLRCHSTIPNGEQTDRQTVRIVFISHKLHTEKKALCIDCHRNIDHDTSSPRTNRPRMETCYNCHQAHPRSQACDKCHPINLVYTKKG